MNIYKRAAVPNKYLVTFCADSFDSKSLTAVEEPGETMF
jgi:hypothetical protein